MFFHTFDVSRSLSVDWFRAILNTLQILTQVFILQPHETGMHTYTHFTYKYLLSAISQLMQG